MPKWMPAALSFLVAALYFYCGVGSDFVLNRLCFYVFQARDMARAYNLTNGDLIFFGPEMTGGGNLPGPGYYFLLALSHLLGEALLGAWRILLGLVFLGCAAAFLFFNRKFSLLGAVVVSSLLILAPSTFRNMTVFLNVSYLIPFAILFVIFALIAATDKNENIRRKAFLLASLVGALGLQFHFSIVSFLLALPFLRTNVSLRTQFQGLGVVLLACGPYLLWRLLAAFGFEIGQTNSAAGPAALAPVSLVHMMNYLPSLPLAEYLRGSFFKIVASTPLVLIPIALGSFLTGQKFESPFRRPLLVLILFGAVPFSYWFFADIGNRYGIPFYIALIFLVTVWYLNMIKNDRAVRIFNIAAAITFGAIVFATYLGDTDGPPPKRWLELIGVAVIPTLFLWRKMPGLSKQRGVFLSVVLLSLVTAAQNYMGHSKTLNAGTNFIPRLQHWRQIWGEIYSHTGWEFDKASQRIFYIHHHVEQDAKPSYVFYRRNAPTLPENPDGPDGYFVAFQKPTVNLDAEQVKDWILEQNIPVDVRNALIAGDIELGDFRNLNSLIVPYRVVNTRHIPKYFHNYGSGYVQTGDDFDLTLQPASRWAGPVPSGEYLFKWNECPDLHRFCNTGMFVRLNRDGSKYQMHIRVAGQAISQVSPWISPQWTQAWINPYIEIQCGTKSQRFALASSIGYRRLYATNAARPLIWGNNSLIAPFDRSYEFECKDGVEKITAGRESSEIETIYEIKQIPGQELSTKISHQQSAAD